MPRSGEEETAASTRHHSSSRRRCNSRRTARPVLCYSWLSVALPCGHTPDYAHWSAPLALKAPNEMTATGTGDVVVLSPLESLGRCTIPLQCTPASLCGLLPSPLPWLIQLRPRKLTSHDHTGLGGLLGPAFTDWELAGPVVDVSDLF